MTKFYDEAGREVEITMTTWDESTCSHSPDFSADLILAGGEPYDEDREAYLVQSVPYLIDYCQEWARGETENEADPYDIAERLKRQDDYARQQGCLVGGEDRTMDDYMEMAREEIQDEIDSRCLQIDGVVYDPEEEPEA